MNFRNVPDKTLKRILSYLTFADVSRLRGKFFILLTDEYGCLINILDRFDEEY